MVSIIQEISALVYFLNEKFYLNLNRKCLRFMQQNLFMDGSLDSLVAPVARKSRRRYTAFPLPCNISQLVSYFFQCSCSSFSSSSYLGSCVSSSLSPSLHHWFLLDVFTSSFSLSFVYSYSLLFASVLLQDDAFRFAAFKHNWLDSFTSYEGQEGIADIALLVCFSHLWLQMSWFTHSRHLWFIPPTPAHKSSTLCTIKENYKVRGGLARDGKEPLYISLK